MALWIFTKTYTNMNMALVNLPTNTGLVSHVTVIIVDILEYRI